MTDPRAARAVDATADLAALVAARICHDIANPIGAALNGVELLEMGPPGGGELALVADSVRAGRHRLRFCRLAFGPAEASAAEVSPAEFAAAATDAFGGRRLSVAVALTAPLPRQTARLAALAILCAETALPLGGALRLAGTAARLALDATGATVRLDDGLWARALGQTGAGEVTSSTVQFALFGLDCPRQGRRSDLQRTAEGIRLSF